MEMVSSATGEIKAHVSPPAIAEASKRPVPRVTLLLCVVCTLVFVGIAAQGGQQSWESLAKWGYLTADRVWDGAYWSLISTAFVHLELWHVAANVYWLWILGGVVEGELGPLRYLGFVLASAVVSSSAQIGASGSTGHGASGVVFAIFGLMWASRRTVPAFAQALGNKALRSASVAASTATLFWTWLVLCVVFARTEVGNGAHLGGLLFGILVAQWLIVRAERRRLALAGTGLFVAISLVPLFWCPWSSSWVGHKAYKAHVAHDYESAIAGYRRTIAMGGDRLWALENLAFAYHSRGADKEYVATLADIRALDANAAAEIEDEIAASASRQAEKQTR